MVRIVSRHPRREVEIASIAWGKFRRSFSEQRAARQNTALAVELE